MFSNRELCLLKGAECFFSGLSEETNISGNALVIAEGELHNGLLYSKSVT